MNKVMKDILGRFKDLQFYTGESMDIDGMVALLEYRDIDGESVPVLMFFKHGLDEEKF